MAHELIDAVTATPSGPLTIPVGHTVAISASYTLNGPPPGSPTSSTYSLLWQKVGVPATIDSVVGAAAGTVYTKTIPAGSLTAGTHQFKVVGYVLYDPFDEQDVDSNLITVFVTDITELQATPGTIDEEQGTSTTVTEESATSTTVNEEQATATAVTEESATSTTVTEAT